MSKIQIFTIRQGTYNRWITDELSIVHICKTNL